MADVARHPTGSPPLRALLRPVERFLATESASGIILIAAAIYAWLNLGQSSIAGVDLRGGIGFTMALFIAMLAFGESPALDQAKIGVLSASVCAAILGYLLLRTTRAPVDMAAQPERIPVTT
jgi:Na+/H+ antiporter NhaA